MVVYPNCKINIGLRIVGKREDGYHNLETIFYPIYGLHDELEITKGTGNFIQEGIVVDCDPKKNLIWRCYESMRNLYPQIGEVDIRLKKNIPFGAGLGGGSSDAAFTAKALNELFALGLTKDELAHIVSPLGADCAFFIYNTPCFATGIGDELTPIDLDLSGKRLVMIKPEVAISTREAYASLVESVEWRVESSRIVQEVESLELEHCINDFEASVFPNHPILGQIKKRLLDAGAFYAAMSGSGSTIYGLFENDAEGRSNPHLTRLNEEFASMVIFNDTLTQTQA